MAVAHVFTGQGFNLEQVSSAAPSVNGKRILDQFADTFGYRLPALGELDGTSLKRNEVSAAILLMSAFDMLDIARDSLPAPDFVAGYSVGQCIALHHAGIIDVETTVALVFARCAAMNEAAVRQAATLVAVVGCKPEAIQDALASENLMERCILANDNASGNCTYAVLSSDIESFIRICTVLGAYRVVDLKTTGGWHSPYMSEAVPIFSRYLTGIKFEEPSVKIVDNTDVDTDSLRPHRIADTLTRHLISPVRWRETIKYLASAGVTEVVEVTHFDLLLRMSAFTAPKIKFKTMASVCAV